MKKYYVLPCNVHEADAGMPEYCMFYDAAHVDGEMILKDAIIADLKQSIATLSLRQKIDRLSS